MLSRRRAFYLLATLAVALLDRQPMSAFEEQQGGLTPPVNRALPRAGRASVARTPIPYTISAANWYGFLERALQRPRAYRFLGKASAAEALELAQRTPTYVIGPDSAALAKTDYRHIFLTEQLLMPTRREVQSFADFFEFLAGIDAEKVMIAAGFTHELGHVTGRFGSDRDCQTNLGYTLTTLDVFFGEYLKPGAVERVKARIRTAKCQP